jgi:hypothetical protein
MWDARLKRIRSSTCLAQELANDPWGTAIGPWSVGGNQDVTTAPLGHMPSIGLKGNAR